jgi:hypothetical protein
MSSNVSRSNGSSGSNGSSDVSGDFKNGSLDFQTLTNKLQDPNSSIGKAVQGLDSNNPLLKGIDVTDGINNTEAKTLSGRIQEAQAKGEGNLDNDPLKLSQDEFLKAFGLNGQQRPEETGEAAGNDNGDKKAGGAEGDKKAGGAEGGKEAGGAEEGKGKATKDWNGDGKIDDADKQIEEKLQKIADKSGKSIDEVAEEIGGENGKIDEKSEIDKLDKMAKGAEAGSSGDSQGSNSNGLDNIIQGFSNNDSNNGANSLFSNAA